MRSPGLSLALPWVLVVPVVVPLVAACAIGDPPHDPPLDPETALAQLPSAEVISADADGTPRFLRGALGDVDVDAAAVPRVVAALGVDPDEVRLVAVTGDELGGSHLRFARTLDGLEVVGGELIVHVNAARVAYAASRSAPLVAPVMSARVSADAARAVEPLAASAPRLVYLSATSDGALHLAWRLDAAGTRDGLPIDEAVFVDAATGAVIERHSRIHTARVRKIHDAAHTTALPGALVMSEGDPASADPSVAAVYLHSGGAADCFFELFGRDGHDGAGAPVVSSVHYGVAVANAFWNGSQMAFGDGDGEDFGDLAQAFDVVVHELTHGVTQKTANLVYANEPGALNEAMSDIMAARCEAWRDGDTAPGVWLLGETAFTPAVAGDALRYLTDPTADGISSDFYPERYAGGLDSGGVHLNSGIANLAFALLARGGTHPRGVTTVVVPALGIDQAARIFYRGLTVYLTSTSGFEAARIATAQAAHDLYGATAAVAVEQAWSAVGVEEGMAATTTLTSGVAVANLGHGSGATRTFAIAVPAGMANLRFQLGGGSGNADLYVRHGAPPTATVFDHAPRTAGNEELVTPPAATPGTWYVRLRTVSGYAGATLVASYDRVPVGTQLVNDTPITISGASGSEQVYWMYVPPGATEIDIATTAGGTGDVDLYARYGAANLPVPSQGVYDKSSAWGGNYEFVSVIAGDPPSGIWQIVVKGRTAYAGVTLRTHFVPDAGVLPLTVGQPIGGLAGSTGSRKRYSLVVPANATNLRVKLTGPTGGGEADVFIRKTVEPTLTSYGGYDRLYTYDREAIATPYSLDIGGTWFVMVRGLTTYQNVTLTATYDVPGPPTPLGNGVMVTGLSGTWATEFRFTFEVPPGSTDLRFLQSGGTGDADLYIKLGAPPTTTSYDKRGYLPGNSETVIPNASTPGTWHVMVRGMTTFTNVTLTARYTPGLQSVY